MKSNQEVIKAFVNGKEAQNRNLRSTGTKLVNYHTTLAQRLDNGMVVFNDTKYSVSTSKIQTKARYMIGTYYSVKEHVPIDTYDLSRYM